jgi:hypothetical protein
MTYLRWDTNKNRKLKEERGVSFDEIIQDRFVATKEHPARGNQKLMLFERGGYIWVVPYVVKGDEIFLKTLFPSRKYTKEWKAGGLK